MPARVESIGPRRSSSPSLPLLSRAAGPGLAPRRETVRGRVTHLISLTQEGSEVVAEVGGRDARHDPAPWADHRGRGARAALGLAIPLVLVGVTILAFWPALDNGFVNWDDDKNLL